MLAEDADAQLSVQNSIVALCEAEKSEVEKIFRSVKQLPIQPGSTTYRLNMSLKYVALFSTIFIFDR